MTPFFKISPWNSTLSSFVWQTKHHDWNLLANYTKQSARYRSFLGTWWIDADNMSDARIINKSTNRNIMSGFEHDTD